MSKTRHPKSRAERRRLKVKKDASLERADAINRRAQYEALEQKEALDELRRQVLAVEAEDKERENN